MRHSRVITVCLLMLLFLALPSHASAARGPSAFAAASSAMIGKINQVRARQGLRPLRSSPDLSGSSSRFASWLMGRGTLTHRSGVSASGRFRRLGEALALTSGGGLSVGRTMRMWLNSPSHRAVILTRSMNLVGAGGVQGRFRGRRASIWVVQTGAY